MEEDKELPNNWAHMTRNFEGRINENNNTRKTISTLVLLIMLKQVTAQVQMCRMPRRVTGKVGENNG